MAGYEKLLPWLAAFGIEPRESTDALCIREQSLIHKSEVEMRKLILVLFISALLAACSSEESDHSADTAGEAAEAPMAEGQGSDGEHAETDAPAEAGHEQGGY